MAKLIGPFPFMLEGDPRLFVSRNEANNRVRIVIQDGDSDGFNDISISFPCVDASRIRRAAMAFNDEMRRVETSEAAE